MTDLEARVYIKTGKELKMLLFELMQLNKSIREAAIFLGIAETSVRRYAKKYGMNFHKKELREIQKNFSFTHAKNA